MSHERTPSTISTISLSQSQNKRQLLRFLILGSEKGVYHSKESELTRGNGACVDVLIEEGQAQTVVEKVKKVVKEGRCIRMNAPLMALAKVCRATDKKHDAARKAAYFAVSDVCTTPTHIFTFLECLKKLNTGREEQDQADGRGQKADGKVKGQKADGKVKGQKADGKVKGQKAGGKVEGQPAEGGGQPDRKRLPWNKSVKKMVEEWYKKHDPKRLAMLVTKYRKREGWTHQQLLKNAHIKPKDKALDVILSYVATKGLETVEAKKELCDSSQKVLEYLKAVEEARKMPVPEFQAENDKAISRMVELIHDHELLREHLPPGFLQFQKVWSALVEKMPMIALLRNLGRITSTGLLEDKGSLDLVLRKLKQFPTWNRSDTTDTKDDENCFRIHPYTILTAWYTYKSGKGRKGKVRWNAEPSICQCLEQAFYQSFEHAPQTNQRIMVAMDISDSMGHNSVNSSDSGTSKKLTARVASAAMCLVTLKVESLADVFAFSTSGLQELELGTDCRLGDALSKIETISCERKDDYLDCTMPLVWARDNKKEYDAFIIYTDNIQSFQTSPAKALRDYRDKLGMSKARLAVVGMSSTGFSLADPQDHDMMDVVGFDIKTPDILHDFISGKLSDCA